MKNYIESEKCSRTISCNDVEKGIISNNVYDAFRKKLGEVSISEQLSWRNSLRHMYNVLNTPTIPDDSGIAIEYRLPYTSKRVDFIISGKNTDNSEHAMIVELKQWQEAKTVKGKNSIVKTYVGNAEREVTHPSYQAWSYSKTLCTADSIDIHTVCACADNTSQTTCTEFKIHIKSILKFSF